MEHDSYQLDHKPKKPVTFMGYRIISDQIDSTGLTVVWNSFERVLKDDVPGDVVEFGCYVGTTSLFIRRMLDKSSQSTVRNFHIYDSFEGLPEKSVADKNAAGVDFQAGKLYVSKKELLQQFQSANLKPPIIHKGWFDQLKISDIPERIAFAFLDGDFYDSIMYSLRLVWPRMQPGGILLVDDYNREALPGVTKAVKDFFNDKSMPDLRQLGNIAIFRSSM